MGPCGALSPGLLAEVPRDLRPREEGCPPSKVTSLPQLTQDFLSFSTENSHIP